MWKSVKYQTSAMQQPRCDTFTLMGVVSVASKFGDPAPKVQASLHSFSLDAMPVHFCLLLPEECSIHATIRSFSQSFIRTFVCLFTRVFIASFLHSFIPAFLHCFIPSCIHAFIHSFIHAFISPYIQPASQAIIIGVVIMTVNTRENITERRC